MLNFVTTASVDSFMYHYAHVIIKRDEMKKVFFGNSA